MTLILVCCAAAAVILCAAYVCYRKTFCIRREGTLNPFCLLIGEQYEERESEMLRLIRAAVKIPCEDVFVQSADGLRLHGRYYETAPGAPVQILMHGYNGNPLRDFSGGLLFTLRCGYNVILIDQRAHGQSEGRCITFGVREREDCLSWIRYANARFGEETPIVLTGISMGAATVLMASELELPDNVAGIIADCGYSSPREIIRKVIREMHLPVWPVYPLIRLGGRVFGGFDLERCSPETALRSCRIPVLFIHGEDDRFVPCEMSRKNFEVCAAPKRLLTVPEAGHGLSYLVDRRGYTETVREFLSEVAPVGHMKKA